MCFFRSKHAEKMILTVIFGCLLPFFASCSSPASSGGSPSPEPEPNPQPGPGPGQPEKTYLKIDNKTPYVVNIYLNDPPLYDTPVETLRQVPKGGSQQWELQPTPEEENGVTLYFEYLIPVGDTVIPYYPNSVDYVRIKRLEDRKVNVQEVPTLISAQTDSIYVLIKNSSKNDTFWFQQGMYTRNPYGSSIRDIPAGTDALFVFNSNITSLSDSTVGNLTRRNFPNTSLEKGNIYSFIVDGTSEPGLFLIEPFDPNMQSSIWTIPTYTTPVPGRIFTVGLLGSRQNTKSDGYILAGRVNYGLDTVISPQVGSLPYLGMISPSGEITRERRITLKNDPSGLNLRRFFEDSNELIYVGQAYYEDQIGQPFILSTDLEGRENYYYDGFADDIDASYQELHGYRTLKWNASDYVIGCDIWEWNSDSQDWQSQIYIAKVVKQTWDSVTHQEFWRSPKDGYNVTLIDVLYDQTHDVLIVLGDIITGSAVYFVDASTGELKYQTIYLQKYWMNGLFAIGSDYYVAGGYEGVSNTRGFVAKIDVLNGTVNTQSPWLIDPTRYGQGSASIWNILPENDGTLVLAGWCVEYNYNTDSSEYRPWLVRYNLTTRSKIWEQVYEDHKGYAIFSVHHNAIGSYLVEIHNTETYHSYLVSTDLLGKMSGNVLGALPRDISLFTVAAPGRPGVNAVITPLSDAGLSTPATLTVTKGQSGTVTVQGTWASYQWYVNGESVTGTGSGYTFSTSARGVGVYTVTAVVTDSAGEKRSASCRITVTN